AVRAREDMLAVVSHDLRTPLSTISLSAGLLARRLPQRPDAEPLQRLVLRVRQAVKRMEYLIGDLLDLARLDTGRLMIEPSPVPAAALLEEALATQRPLAQQKGLALTAQNATGEARACCDPNRVMQVFGNLIGNAIKFCEPGGSIEIGAREQGQALRFHVS